MKRLFVLTIKYIPIIQLIGKVRMNIPVINKVIEFDTDDVKTLKETLISK